MNELVKANALNGETLKSLIDMRVWQHHALNFDFMLYFLVFALDFDGSISHSSATLDKTTPRTKVKNRPSFLDSLALFFEVLTRGGISHVDPSFLHWNPRDRLGASGFLKSGASVVNHKVGDFFNFFDVDQRDVELDFHEGSGFRYISPDLYFDFVWRFLRHKGEDNPLTEFETWEQEASLWFWPYVYTKYVVTHFDNDYLSYNFTYARLTTSDLGTAQGSGCRYGVTISRVKTQPYLLSIKVSEGVGQYFDFGVWSSDLGIFRAAGSATQVGNVTLSDGSDYYSDLRLRSGISVISSYPALYHTQSKAYYKHLGEVSRNFESFMESPGFFPILWELATDTPKGLLKVLGENSVVNRVRSLVRLICGVYFAYIFAIKPSLESARDIFDSLSTELAEATGEASITFKGNGASFDTLPANLRSIVTALHSSEVSRFNIRFASYTKLAVTRQRLINVIDSLLVDSQRFGIEPDPTYLWAALPFSFVFDWFIPMGTLMRDAYHRYKLIGTRGLAFGHSVSYTVIFEDGIRIHAYIRSDATDLYIDPPGDSWLQAPGAPAVIAVPLALLQLL